MAHERQRCAVLVNRSTSHAYLIHILLLSAVQPDLVRWRQVNRFAFVDVAPSIVVTALQMLGAPRTVVWCLRNVAALWYAVHIILVPAHVGLVSEGFATAFLVEVTPDDFPIVLVRKMILHLLPSCVPITAAGSMRAKVQFRPDVL